MEPSESQILLIAGVVQHGYVLLSNVIQLLPELKLMGCHVGDTDFLQVLPRFFKRLGVSNVAKHVIVITCCQAIHDSPLAPMLRSRRSWSWVKFLVCR